jgi:DNA-binding transcriptional MerR regulator
MTAREEHLTISEVAGLTGLTVHTLRYYESAGLLLTPVQRESSSHRSYSSGDVAWITFLTRLRSTALPIRQVKEYAELARLGDDTRADRLELLQRHRIAVVAQLAEMTASLAAIDYKIDLYSDALSADAARSGDPLTGGLRTGDRPTDSEPSDSQDTDFQHSAETYSERTPSA